MKIYQVQVGATDPEGWHATVGESMSHAAASVAARVLHGIGGKITVYVHDATRTYSTGAPIVVHRFDMVVLAPDQEPLEE